LTALSDKRTAGTCERVPEGESGRYLV
jgi:hypothetical protein